MNDTEIKVALPDQLEQDQLDHAQLEQEPLTSEEITIPHTQQEQKPQKAGVLYKLVHNILPGMLFAVSAAVFSFTAISMTMSAGLSLESTVRLMIGDMTGGAGYVKMYAISSPIRPHSNISIKNISDSPSQSSPGQAEPYEPAKVPDTITNDTYMRLSNETPYSPDMNDILSKERAVKPLDELYAEYGEGSPVVLIIHTHGSEAYSSCAGNNYRSTDCEKNVVALGEIIADELNAAGISALHCKTMFDQPDFNMAYYNASLQIREYIKEYPSISYIIDVHRDSVVNSDGEHIPLSATIDGSSAAQIMFVVGTDHGGSGHTGWRDNLALAARMTRSIDEKYPDVTRDINLRSASFNEQYTSGSLIVEIGTCANSLDEAGESARLFAAELIEEITG